MISSSLPLQPNSNPKVVPIKKQAVTKGNITIYIGTESDAINPVMMKVAIDSNTIVDTAFYEHLMAPNYCYYEMDLTPGQHQISIEADNGNVTLFREFEVSATSNVAFIRYNAENKLDFDIFGELPEA